MILPFLSLESGLILVGSLLLSAAASILLKTKTKSPIQDQEPTTLSSRGSYIPQIIGRRRTGSVIGWVGDRQVRNDGGGGKKGGKGSGSGVKSFYEAAWHQLCVGPAAALHRIWQDGKIIFEQTITPGTHPSGTTVTADNGEGTFVIYWGEPDQPVNAFLGDLSRVTINSRWPFVCYVVWTEKRLGPVARWPVLDYDIEVDPYNTTLVSAPAVMASTGDPNGPDDGVNPAHALEQLLTAPFPHGVGHDPALYDFTSLEALAALAASEQLAISIAARDGEEAAGLIASLMQDVGLFLTSIRGVVHFIPIRPPTPDQPVLSEDLLIPPRHEVDNLVGERTVDSLIFVLKDRNLSYRDQAITIDEDGQARYTDTKRGQQIGIDSTVNFPTAAKIADRRSLEEVAGNVKYTLYSNHEARRLYPGQSILAHEIPVSLRVLTVKPEALSSKVVLECLADFYGVDGTDFVPSPFTPPTITLAPAQNHSVNPTTWPPGEPGVPVGGPPHIVVPSLRAHAQIVGQEIWISTDGSSYHMLGLELGLQSGGTLDEDFNIGAAEVDPGPEFTALGPDINLVLDLSSADLEKDWRAGRQIMIVGDEVMYVRWIEALGGDTYRCREVLRAQKGTSQADHDESDDIHIFRDTAITPLTDVLLEPSETVSIKVRPFTAGSALDLSSVPAVPYTVPS